MNKEYKKLYDYMMMIMMNDMIINIECSFPSVNPKIWFIGC